MTKKIIAALVLALSLGVPAAASVMPQDYSYFNGGMNQWESDVYFFNLAYPEKIAVLENNLHLAEAELKTLQGQADAKGKQLRKAEEPETASLDTELAAATQKVQRTRKGLLLLKGEIEKLKKDKEYLEDRTDLSFLPVRLPRERSYDLEGEELLAEKYIMPAVGFETSPYGWRIHPVTGVRSMHNGIDLANDQGTAIHAAKSGVVKVAGYNEFSGNNLLLRHYDGQETAYYHMHELIAEEGQYVLQGDVIGLMGTTGRSTGSHLHFEIRINGERVDPDPYIYHRTRRERR